MSDEKQRAMMAAHLCDLAASAIRAGDRLTANGIASVLIYARWMIDPDGLGATTNYRDGLQTAGLTPAQIDAAVASIQRGEEPADSLTGKVRAMHATSLEDIGVAQTETRRMACAGQAHAFGAVLALLGVTP